MQLPPTGAVRLNYSVELGYEVHSAGSDFIFNVQAARTPSQQVREERLHVSQDIPLHAYTDPATCTRFLRVHAGTGPLHLHYQAAVDVTHHRAEPAGIAETRICDLPGHVLPYLYPSRYCQSDRLNRFAMMQFGGMRQGYSRVQAIRDWVLGHVLFSPNSSSGTTSACDTLVEKRGVCRDFAHLMIALCRAVNIPARFTTGIDYGADPALGPQDFHAYVEAYVGDRWYMFDPSGTAIPMGFIRLASGRDAADAAFASIFGSVETGAPVLRIEAVPGADGVLRVPVHVDDGLSTDDGTVPGASPDALPH